MLVGWVVLVCTSYIAAPNARTSKWSRWVLRSTHWGIAITFGVWAVYDAWRARSDLIPSPLFIMGIVLLVIAAGIHSATEDRADRPSRLT